MSLALIGPRFTAGESSGRTAGHFLLKISVFLVESPSDLDASEDAGLVVTLRCTF